MDSFSSNFYKWERCGRGTSTFETCIQLEPNFVPFFHIPVSRTFVDTGKKKTIFNRIGEWFDPPEIQAPEEEFEYSVDSYGSISEEYVTFLIVLPKGFSVQVDQMEQLLVMLSISEYPICFEIATDCEEIRFLISCDLRDKLILKSQLSAYFPFVILTETSTWEDLRVREPYRYHLTDFVLQQEFVRPLQSAKSFSLDPFSGFIGLLDQLNKGEAVVLQILFQGTVNPWAPSMLRAVTDGSGGPFFTDAPDMLPLCKEKISSGLFAVSVRLLVIANVEPEIVSLIKPLANSICQFSKSPFNTLIPIYATSYIDDEGLNDFCNRQTRRCGLILNTKELLTLVHFPSSNIVSKKLKRIVTVTHEPPRIALGNTLILGTNYHDGTTREVSLEQQQRFKHMHVIGGTGSGKSTFLLDLILQDINAGTGVAVLDPHGDLIEAILPLIPEERLYDVVVIDPSDEAYSIGLNVLSAHSGLEKELLASDLVAMFKRLSTSWGDQMNSVFANAIIAFLENTENGSLVELQRFLIEKPFREKVLKTVTDPSIRYYWKHEFPLLKSSSIGPILTRLDAFLRPKAIRHMVSQKEGLDFTTLLNSQKILLVKLSQGLIGSENSYLLGSFIVGKIHQAAMARQVQLKDSRSDFFLYIDEFQHFITESMSNMLSGARKYNLGLILAHQDMQQVTKQDTELASSILSNAGTRVCFRLSEQEAKKFQSDFTHFTSQDLQNLGTGDALVKIDRPDFDFNLKTRYVQYQPEANISERIINHSQTTYGTLRSEIELQLQQLWDSEVGKSVREEPASPQRKVETFESQQVLHSESIPLLNEEKEEVQKDTTHRYLQMLIKKMAESRGYVASLEQPTADGSGLIDVVLQKDGERIACEISDTTGSVWEYHNIEKCITSGFTSVYVCTTNPKTEKQLKQLVQERSPTFVDKVNIGSPAVFFEQLDSLLIPETTVERVKGYRVKVEFEKPSIDEIQQKRVSIANVLLGSMKKLKKDK